MALRRLRGSCRVVCAALLMSVSLAGTVRAAEDFDKTSLALRTALHKPEVAGTYHAVNQGETSWHGYAEHVIEFARRRGQEIKVAPDAIVPVPTSAFPTPAKRPGNSRMNTQKLRDTFGLALPAWQTGVERMLTEILS